MRTNVLLSKRDAILRRLDESRKADFAADEQGSLTIFSIFLFVLLLLIAGMAVDVMHYESERVALQNATDSGILAAASMSQEASSDKEIEVLVKEYVAKAGYDPDMINVSSNIEMDGNGLDEVRRSVSASIDFQVDTMFMSMMGIDYLNGYVSGGAQEAESILEIALVLDISGSMNSNSKLSNLKRAAKDFVTSILDNNSPQNVFITIVPYNHQVYMNDDLLARINLDNNLIRVRNNDIKSYYPNGAIDEYETLNPNSRCARFASADFGTRRLMSGTSLDVSGVFADENFQWRINGQRNQAYSQPYNHTNWCNDFFAQILLYENDETLLHDYIDAIVASGYTAIDYGMNWGVGMLDPSMEPVTDDMVRAGILPARVGGHPAAYNDTDVRKYVVLMTDGMNTAHIDLKDQYKAGPSRIWYSETQANGTEFNGFLVEMPNNATASRWYVPGSPTSTGDDRYLSATGIPADAVQWSYHELYERFQTRDVAEYFFRYSDPAAYSSFRDATTDTGGYGTADSRVDAICAAARANNAMEVFTVAFEAPPEAETLLQNCASKAGNYFDVEGTQISDAFTAIAVQISQLRLTE